MTDRFVVLGVAGARAPWFRSLALWATSGAVPVEFVKCVSAAEVRARIAGGRRYSAVVADGGLPSVDRDLLLSVRAAGCAALVIHPSGPPRDWLALGASGVLAAGFSRDELVSALSAHAATVSETTEDPSPLSSAPARIEANPWRGTVVVVTGPGGTGVSTAAQALAEAAAVPARRSLGPPGVLLADLRLHAEQAMLHDAGDVTPGVQELVEGHRSGVMTPEAVRDLTFEAPAGYDLLLGLRRARFWPAIRPRAFDAAFDSLRRTYSLLVCDVDADLEGEEVAGSTEVEDRNVMARTSVAAADVVLVVGLPGTKGFHCLLRVMADLADFGVAPERVLVVVNRAPRSPRARARLAATMAQLGREALGGVPGGLVFLPDRDLERARRDAASLPATLGSPLAAACRAVLQRAPALELVEPDVVRVVPGSLMAGGSW